MKSVIIGLLVIAQAMSWTWFPGQPYHIRSVEGTLQYSRSGGKPRCVVVLHIEGVEPTLHLTLDQKVCTDAGLLLSQLER